MDPTRSLSIGYYNSYGLGSNKWREIRKNIFPSFDILFVAETWYQLEDSIVNDPLFLAQTALAPEFRKVDTRQHGGIIAFIDPSIRAEVSRTDVNRFSITVSIRGETIHAVYLPPSLNNFDYESFLQPKDLRPSLIVGDLNCRIHSERRAMIDNPGRIDICNRVAGKHRLSYVYPLEIRTDNGWNHAYCKEELQPIITFFDIKEGDNSSMYNSTHPLVEVKISVGGLDKNVESASRQALRFHLRRLELPDKRKHLEQLVQSKFEDLSVMLEMMEKDFENDRFDVGERRKLVNLWDDLAYSAIRDSCQLVLGSYRVQKVDNSIEYLNERLVSSVNMPDAVMAYKRLFNGSSTVNAIESRDLNRSPMEETVQHYSRIFDQPDAKFHPKNTGVIRDEWIGRGGSGVSGFLSADSVGRYIHGYPKTKCCGEDALHGKILRAIFPKKDGFTTAVLARYFQLCANHGTTPERWNYSIVAPLMKTKEARFADETRPVALTAMFRRYFETGVLGYFYNSDECSKLREFCPSQGGFRQGFSCISHAMVADEAAKRRRNLFQVLLDLEWAYDRTVIVKLIEKMILRNAHPGLISLICALFLDCYSSIIVNGTPSDYIEKLRGLFQGSLLSPFLFDV